MSKKFSKKQFFLILKRFCKNIFTKLKNHFSCSFLHIHMNKHWTLWALLSLKMQYIYFLYWLSWDGAWMIRGSCQVILNILGKNCLFPKRESIYYAQMLAICVMVGHTEGVVRRHCANTSSSGDQRQCGWHIDACFFFPQSMNFISAFEMTKGAAHLFSFKKVIAFN